ncbi:hypothetical protein [Streptomyces platensis]|uniref:hypothetical protein n=1 Tax=Streptomyces platensis TaxID=58346 RepID=UPI003866FEA8|nr:hypothetical protein OG962_30695 [Streptomyces platensis]
MHDEDVVPADLVADLADGLQLGLLSCMTHYAMRWLRNPRWNRAVQWVCGLTLLVLGLQVALTTSN